ncbi:MAG: peptidylprolyl isomerase [Deltaproteobacteria bacterium RIFOXYA12_FULL_58_15]|nr:MAG: peptidylprolyl isomerase [Deltaproteobacteria bacterium RIFOXYA12_FULL_58_15]
MAHVKFGTATNEFFELVRSRTAPGEPLDLVATVRPYDDPGSTRVFYRFRKIYSTIVVKTHMVFVLDDAKLRRFNELFIEPTWLQPPKPVGYDPKLSANPFAAFEQIPPLSRYQFLLDNANYVIKTFIHGPVCKGQIALNVLDDHFWIMFMDPAHDVSVAYPGFLRLHSEKLRMPIDKGSDYGIFDALSDEYRKAAVEFYKVRQDLYESHNHTGLGYESIWKGAVATDTPVLTVYRHFESASVHRGLLGNLPKTMWVIDYPLLERIYYALVAGFDVYGTAGHQLALRNYMDALRVEGESYFLDFMPPAQRQEMMQSWYKDVDLKNIHYYPSALPAKIAFVTANPKREFIEELVNDRFAPAAHVGLDPVNYLLAGDSYPGQPAKFASPDDYLRAFRSLSQPGMPFLAAFDDSNTNLAFLRIRLKNGRDVAGSVVVNRWHDNVAFKFAESGALDASKDSADFIPGLIGSYPNYFFDLREEDLSDFIDLFAHFEKGPRDAERLARYGVNRADERLWDAYDWFQSRFFEDEPVDGGLFDLNRYYYDAR